MTTYDPRVIRRAIRMIEERHAEPGEVVTATEAARQLAVLHLGELERECFACAWLTTGHALIKWEPLFWGSVDRAIVHPREVVKAALAHNAAAVVLAHNHPSGNPEPSQSDIALTEELRRVLAIVDVRVLDHIVVGHGGRTVSMAESGVI